MISGDMHLQSTCTKCISINLKEKYNNAVAEERRISSLNASPSKKLKNFRSCGKDRLAKTLKRATERFGETEKQPKSFYIGQCIYIVFSIHSF